MFKLSDVEENIAQPASKKAGFVLSDVEQPDLTKIKPQNVFSIDGENTNAPQKMNLVNQSWVEKFAQSDLGKFGDTQSKAVVRGVFDIAGGLGTMIRFYGDNMILPKGAFDLDDKTIDRINTFGRGWQKFGSSIKKGSDFVLNSKTLELDKDIFAGDIIDNPSITRVSSAIMSAAPSLLGMVGMSRATGSAGLAYFVMGGVDSADVYEKAKESGKTQETANLLYTSSQVGTALIDRMLSPLEKIMGNSPSTIWKKLSQKIASGLAEGSAEGAQTVWQNAVTKYGIDDTQALMDGVIEAAIGGFGSGALAAGTFNTAAERLKEKGATDRDIENISQAAIDYVQKHPDEINNIAFQQLNKGLDEFDKFVETHKGTPEAQKALQTKADLEQVYTDVSERLKKAGIRENVANADAKVWQGIALWGSQELGISPLEYINQRMPKIESMTYNQFQNKERTLEEQLGDYIPFQAMYKSPLSDMASFYDDVLTHPEKKKRYFSHMTPEGITVDVLSDTIAHDQKHNMTANNWQEVLDNIDNVEAFVVSDKPRFDGQPVLMKIKTPSGKYGVVFEHMQNGRNIVTTAFKDSDKNIDIWMKKETGKNQSLNANAADTLSSQPTAQEGKNQHSVAFASQQSENSDNPISNSANRSFKNIIAVLDENVNKPLFQLSAEAYNKQGKADVNSEAFKRWFGDSKVVDESGQPLVVYRGMSVNAFNSPNKFNNGSWFSSAKDYAKLYSKGKGIFKKSKVYPVYLSIKKPFYIGSTDTGFDSFYKKEDFYKNIADRLNIDTNIIADKLKNVEGVWVYSIVDSKEFSDLLKESGYDGIEAIERGNHTYKTFYSNQIKSVYNRGTFDPNNDNIYYQSAFAGSRVDYDRPSLEAIGSGEGAQVHGWGLYYALNKEVAEAYRKNFVTESDEYNYEYNMARLNKIEELGREKAIEHYTNKFNDAQKALDRFNSEHTKQEIMYDDDLLMEQSDLQAEVENAKYDLDYAKNYKSGQVHEVDIPENPYLLDEQKTFSEQSDFVKEKLKNLEEEIVGKYGFTAKFAAGSSLQKITGRDVYRKISNILGSDKAATQLLEKYGIKGITYDGKQDGRCFVIFNPADVKVIQKFYQDNAAPKGAYVQNLDRNGVIYLFERADASTFMHETAHFFRKELQSFDTARSRDILKKMDECENTEFDKRYKVVSEGNVVLSNAGERLAGRYVVTDKIGNIIYDRGFASEQAAREYARNEIFARGFEQYLREGKAPSNYLKQAFRSFWNWLRHLYKTAEELNVELSDSIRNVYGNIIGGKDLDFYLTAPVDEVLQQHWEENKERQKVYDEQIALAQAQPIKRGFFRNVARERTDGAKGRNEWWNKAFVPISTRAKRVNIKFRNRLRQYDYVSNNKLNQYYAQIKPFLDKWAKMTETDAIAFDLALKNSYVEKQLEIVNKYDAYDEFVAVENLLNSLFDQAVSVGIDMGYSSDYFPRQIDDVEGFMSAMYGSPYASQLRRALKEADPDDVMTVEEKAEFFNKYLRGFNRRDLNKPLPGNVKDRTIDIVTAEMNKYYKPSMQALISYIEGMNTSIESRKFWGFKSDDIDKSIGALTADLVDTGLIKPEQDAEVQAILKARFKAKGVTNKWLNLQKNISYIYMMGGINSAITQIDDISTSLYKAGLWNTVEAVFSRNRPGLSREELGLERIGQEFVEASSSSKAVNTVFKLTGLDRIDAFGKNTLINATFNKFQKMAENNEKELHRRLEPVLEAETSQTIADIKNGVISENVKLLMFNELADMQPIALSEMPEWYLTSGNGRVFYMLKTFMLKRLDIFRNECFDKIRGGDTGEGVQNLFRLAVLMIMAGSAKDAIIDMLFGREFDFTDTMVNNLLGLAGISKYSLYKARDEGFSGFASSFIIPPVFASTSDLLSDIYKSLFSQKGKDVSDYEIWKGLPLIGRFYYWWWGGGRAKENRKKDKGNKLK